MSLCLVLLFIVYHAECRYAECRYTGCRGATSDIDKHTSLLQCKIKYVHIKIIKQIHRNLIYIEY